MRRQTVLACSALLVLCACQRGGEQENNVLEPTQNSAAPRVSPAPDAEIQKSAGDNAASLPEPQGSIDSKSAEAAGQVVQSYGALIEQGRWKEGNGLWGDSANATKFQTELAQFGDVHLEIGNPGEPEGAAGSIYLTMPVIFYGDLKNGQPFRRPADVILRRVNDVPGSTEEQRRWHIERIDWAS